jgi:WD40 repeat protein
MIRSRKRRWLSLVIVVAALGGGLLWWSVTEPPGLHLRAILVGDPNPQDQDAIVRGFSPDSSMLVSAGSQRDAIIVWDVASGKIIKTFEPEEIDQESEDYGEPQGLSFLGFSPDGKVMAVANDRLGIKLWDTSNWQVRGAINALNVTHAHFFSDNKTLLVQSPLEPQIWDMVTGKKVATLEAVTELTEQIETWLAPDEKTLVAVVIEWEKGGYKWRADTWDTARWRTIRSIRWTDTARCDNGVSPDGRVVAGIDDDGRLKVWNLATGRMECELKLLEAERPHSGTIECAWSPAGECLLACFYGGPLLLCDIEKKKTIRIEDRVVVRAKGPCYSWSTDGRTFAVLADRSVTKNQWILGLPAAVQRQAISVFGSPSSLSYHSVKLHDARTGRVGAERWETEWFESVSFSPDASMMAVGDWRAKIHLYDVPEAQPSPQ